MFAHHMMKRNVNKSLVIPDLATINKKHSFIFEKFGILD